MKPIDLPPAEHYAHGTRARYVAGCRCAPCRASNLARYHSRQAEMHAAAVAVVPSGPPGTKVLLRGGVEHHVRTCPGANGRDCVAGEVWLRKGEVCTRCIEVATVWNGLVGVDQVRAHVEALGGLGVGYKSVAAAAGVATSTLASVMAGRKRRLRRQTAERILQVDTAALADSAHVDARPIWALVRDLRRWGMGKAEISRRLGNKVPALQLGRRQVLARNAQAVEKLHRAVQAERARPKDCEDCLHVDRCRVERRFPGGLCLLACEVSAA